MAYFTKLIFIALSGIDPLIFIAPICLGLGVCSVAAMTGLEQIRTRWQQRSNAKRRSPNSEAVFHQPPSDHQN
jgi:hypothetical protein